MKVPDTVITVLLMYAGDECIRNLTTRLCFPSMGDQGPHTGNQVCGVCKNVRFGLNSFLSNSLLHARESTHLVEYADVPPEPVPELAQTW